MTFGANTPAARRARLEKLLPRIEEALEFYADPFEYIKRHELDELTPDFYDELDFGERAAALLTELKALQGKE